MKKISYKLFKVYVSFFSLFVSSILIIFGLYVGMKINKSIISTQEQMIQSINKNIDSFFEDMNDFSISLKDSTIFKDTAICYLPKSYETNSNLSSYFRDMYFSAYKMIEKNYKVGIYTYDGYYIWLGNNYFINKTEIDGSVYYKNYAKYGLKNINYIHNNIFLEEYLKKNKSQGFVNEPTVVLSRTINKNNIFNIPQAMLEIHIPYKKLEQLMDQLIKDTEDMKLSLFDVNGNIIYGSNAFNINKYIINGEINEGTFRDNNNIINIKPLESADIYMVSIIQSSKLYSSLIIYSVLAVVIFLLVNILLIFITYKIAIKITTPLRDISKQIENIDLQQINSNKYNLINTDIYEINILNNTINKMQEKLANSLNKIVSLESYEIQSKLLALQSQMQPHFLYNTIMTISALSENNENEKVSKVCFALTHMLRYISSDNNSKITLADEIEYVDRYIDIMKERFEYIDIDWNIPFDMFDILIPKLIIQPLVENSLKYNEKCDIKINGLITNNQWTIEVIDNGVGFNNTTINDIMYRCKEISKNYRTANLEIDGMGILNIYIRLNLLYGENMNFNISNFNEGGCCVKIGGVVKRLNNERDI